MTTKQITRTICAALAAVTLSGAAVAPALAVDKAGDVVSVRGKAVIERKAGKENARVSSALLESDNIVTREKSRIKMLFRDDSILTLGANSKLVIKKYLYSPQSKRAESIYELADGKLRAAVGGSGFKVTTPTAFAAARGTVLVVSYNAETNTTQITVLEGSVEVRNVNAEIPGSQIVGAGQSTTVTGNKPPTTPRPVDLKGVAEGDDRIALSVPDKRGERGPNIFSELHDLAENKDRLNKPIEQEPPHAVTNVNLNVTFR
jgi:hypothetical protein